VTVKADKPSHALPPDFDAGSVRAQLQRILASSHFRNSRRSQALLEYTVETTCHGHADGLKERVVGAAVFGRDAAYDTNQDAVVRNAAAEVRKRLAQYYLDPGHESELRIDLLPGSYIPEFRPAAAPPRQRRPAWIVWGIAALALAATALLSLHPWRWLRSEPASALDQFWAPLLASRDEIQICTGQSRGYTYFGKLPAKGSVAVTELASNRSRFLWYGDAICQAKLGALISGHRGAFRYRRALDTPYAELRGRPVVLIGQYNNTWTMRVGKDLRFSLDRSEAEGWRAVHDRLGRSNFRWQATGPLADPPEDETDYAIVSRIYDSSLEHWVVICAGITHYGTMNAGELVSNPTYFSDALRDAPADWARKNLQFVIETHISGGTPGPPKVLAAHFW
jgi:hypothetical protein